jgi:DNA-binding transcriptional regulator YdaS (Cro superfamily)
VLIDDVGTALTGRDPDSGASFGALLDRLAGLAGSGSKAARVIGVNPTTFNRWRRGVMRPKGGDGVVRRAIRKQEVPTGLLADIKAKRKTLKIVGTVSVSNDKRRGRKCDVGAHIPKGVMTRILNLWFAGDDEKANSMLWTAIDKHYVEGMDIESVDYCEFS